MNSGLNWYFYKGAVLPMTAPHEEVILSDVNSKEFWKKEGKKTLFIRWTSKFDNTLNREWWYVIKDNPFNISTVKSNYRYKINKGSKRFKIRKIDPLLYVKEIYGIQLDAYSGYPQKYRPNIDESQVKTTICKEWCDGKTDVYGSFSNEENKLVGYCLVRYSGKCIYLVQQKVIRIYEKEQVNAALVYGMLNDIKEKLEMGYYVCDGERNVIHETAFQEYLEKYFGFRKAYCDLNIIYRPIIGWFVKKLYAFRKIFRKLDNISIIHKINGVLQMEEIVRNQR